MYAVFGDTAVKEYQLFPRLVGVLLLSALVIHLWHRLQERKGIAPQRRVKALFAGALLFIPIFKISAALAAAFIPMMESTGKAQPAPNRNSSMKPSSMMDRPCTAPMPPINGATEKVLRPLTVEEVRAAIWLLGGNGNAATIDEAFTRTKKTVARVAAPPCRGHLRGKLCPLAPFAFL